MAAFRHRSHSIIYLVTRRFSRAYLLQIGLLLLTLQSVFEVLQIRTWHMNQSILQSSQQVARAHQGHQHDYGRIFITSLHWNNEAVLPRWSAELVKLVQVLGRENVFVSIFESGSWDASKSLLGGLDERLSAMHVERNITLGAGTHEEFVSQRPGKSKKEGWVKTLRGKEDMRRIPYLASLRNQGLEQLVRLSEAGNAFDKVLYLGDVVFQVEDVLNLLNTNKGEYAAACSLDFSRAPAFYDTFALRDSEGYEHVTQTWPYFRSQKSRKAMKLMEPVPVRSCWNGIVAMPADPFVSNPPLRFRGVSDSLAEFHVEGSECCLVHADNPLSISRGVFMNPNVRVGYNPIAYDAVHPQGQWLSSFDILTGIWKNRLGRWASIPRIKRYKIAMRLKLWRGVEPQGQEPGEICLNDEMQIIVGNGWAHV